MDLHPSDLTILDACAGAGMLGESVLLGLDAIGFRGRVICHIERDSAAAAALVARMEGSPVDQAPVADSLESFDGREWAGVVDIACAGLPCPAFSSAGQRKGNSDHRAFGEDGNGPQAQFLRIIAECRPAVVFLENVPEWVTGGSFRRFGEQLSGMGYTIEDPLFIAAEDVGAPHERERVFILAHAGLQHIKLFQWPEGAEYSGVRGELGNAEHGRARGLRGEPGAGRRTAGPDARRCELPLFPPGRGDIENPDHPDWWAWAAIAAMDATVMPRVESPVPTLVDGMARADELRIGGNGVVPLAAGYAFATLLSIVIARMSVKPVALFNPDGAEN